MSRRETNARELAAYLEGEVTTSERAAIDSELSSSAQARNTLRQLQKIVDHLAAPAPDLEGIDLEARVRAAMHQPLPAPRTRRRLLPVWLVGVAACLGGLVLYLARPPEAAEFRAKSNGVLAVPAKRWAGIQIYKAIEHSTPELLGTEISPSDGLLFSYTNLGARPFDYLMIFAVDARGEVSWFYPAHEQVGENPESISIRRERANVPLGEVIRQDFAAGPLSLYALFTRESRKVLEIEAWVKEHGRPLADSVIFGPDEVIERIDARVEP
jgi:hypothetical protein